MNETSNIFGDGRTVQYGRDRMEKKVGFLSKIIRVGRIRRFRLINSPPLPHFLLKRKRKRHFQNQVMHNLLQLHVACWSQTELCDAETCSNSAPKMIQLHIIIIETENHIKSQFLQF